MSIDVFCVFFPKQEWVTLKLNEVTKLVILKRKIDKKAADSKIEEGKLATHMKENGLHG